MFKFTIILFVLLVPNYTFADISDISLLHKEMLIQNEKEIEFIENKGQLVDKDGNYLSDVLFYAKLGDRELYIRNDGISFITFKYEDNLGNAITNREDLDDNDLINVIFDRQDMNFVGSNNDIEVIGENRSKDFNNYYLPQCPQGIKNVQKFRKIIYRDLYDKIDMEIYTNSDGYLEYDFIVLPNGNPNDIALVFPESNGLKVTQEGNLKIETWLEDIEQLKPFAYQEDKTNVDTVTASFEINDGIYCYFKLGAYDNTTELIIDPVTRNWGTYYSGNCGNNSFFDSELRSVDYDSKNNYVFLGAIYCGIGVASDGSYQTTVGGEKDMFIVMLDPNGNRLWSTYYGGSGNEFVGSIAVCKNDNIFITGSTNSKEVMGEGGWQSEIIGNEYNYCIAKFSNSGYREWGTYYGYAKDCDCNRLEDQPDIAVDKDCNVYFCAVTDGEEIFGDGGMQPEKSAKKDVVLAKFSSEGQRLWGTYYGGNANENFARVTLNSKDEPIIAGATQSNNVMGENGWMDVKPSGSGSSGYIAKFSVDGVREWGTYFGGNNVDIIRAVEVGEEDNIYIAGTTSSPGIGIGKNQGEFINTDQFILAKFSPDGEAIWASYLGCGAEDYGVGLSYDGSGSIVFGGYTKCSDLSINGGFQQDLYINSDLFLTKITKDGLKVWSTYYGGNNEDILSDLIYNDNLNNIVLTGTTRSADVIGKDGYQEDKSSSSQYLEPFIANLQDHQFKIKYLLFDKVCQNSPLEFEFELDNSTTFSTEYFIILSDTNGSFEESNIIGSFNSSTSGTYSILIPESVPTGSGYKVKLLGSDEVFDLEILEGISTSFKGPGNVCSQTEQTYTSDNLTERIYKWEVTGGTIIGPDNESQINVLWEDPGTGKITLSEWIEGRSCNDVEIKNVLIDYDGYKINGKTLVCQGEYEQKYSNKDTEVTKLWSVTGGNIIGSNTGDEITVEWTNGGKHEVRLNITVNAGDCEISKVTEVTVSYENIPETEIQGEFAVCSNSQQTYSVLKTPDITYKWKVQGGTIISEDNKNEVTVEWGTPNNASIELIETTPLGCLTGSSKQIFINAFGREIFGDLEVCTYGTYYVDHIENVENEWTAIGGTIISGEFSDTIVIAWEKGGVHLLKLNSISNNGECSKTLLKQIEQREPENVEFYIPETLFNPKYDVSEVDIPVQIVYSDCLSNSPGIESFTAFMRLKRSLFLPTDNSVQNYTDNGDWRSIVYQDLISNFSDTDILFNLKGYVLLGDIVETPIIIDSIYVNSEKIDFIANEGKLLLNGVEDRSGLRLIKNKNITLSTVYPHPVDTKLNLVIESNISCNSDLKLFNFLGEEILKLTISLKKGTNIQEIELPNNIPNGNYWFLLDNYKTTTSKRIFINK